jgi:hypothetical protein
VRHEIWKNELLEIDADLAGLGGYWPLKPTIMGQKIESVK